MQRSRFFSTAIIGLTGAVIGSFSMMLFASTHFNAMAGTDTTPPPLATLPLPRGGSDQDRIVRAVRRVDPSVVALNVIVNGTQVVPSDPFSQFFQGDTGSGSMIRRYREKASGSGFVYRANGLIVTNAHVVANASSIQVIFQNGDRIPAKIYATDPTVDLALIKVDGYTKLPPALQLGNSNQLSLGQWAIAIGEPFELKQTVTVGVVSGFNRDETIGSESGIPRQFKGLLQTSAPINPGNSGGPLIDLDGRVIGVNQSTASPQFAQGIGFAIPVDEVKHVVTELEKKPGTYASSRSGFIGVQLLELDDSVRQQLNYLGSGVAIAGIISGSPADAAGLAAGDVIQAIDGKPVKEPADVTQNIGTGHIGSWITLTIWSSGTKQTVRVKIAERPTDGG